MSQLRAMKRQNNRQGAEIKKNAEKALHGVYKQGVEDGYYEGAKFAQNLFCDAMETLQTVKGIGPKRYAAILKHFGYNDQSELAKENRY